MVWVQFIFFIVSLVVSYALAPKPQKPKPASLTDFDLPVAEEDRPIPVVFGEIDITGPNICWYGDLGTSKIKKGGIFGSSTVGYRYYLGFDMKLCHGPVDLISAITAADKTAWTGSITASGSGTIEAADLFGGDGREGGIQGEFDICMGEPTQMQNEYLVSKIGSSVPAYRGVTSLIWKTGTIGTGSVFTTPVRRLGYVGNTPYVKPWAVRVRRILKGWANNTVWNSADAVIDGNKMNGAHIIYECLTNPEWGMGEDPTLIDETTFGQVADTLKAENFGLCLLWNQADSIENFITEVLNHIAGVLTFNHSTGKYELKLMRADYDIDDLDEYTEDDLIEVQSFQRQLWGETVNELVLVYTDPTTKKLVPITVQDLANIQVQGARVSSKVTLSGLQNAALAQEVAMRELASRSTPLAKITFTANRRFWRKAQADVFKLTLPREKLDNVPFRVLKIRGGVLTKGIITVEAVEDVFGPLVSSYALQVAPPEAPTIPTVPPDTATTPNVNASDVNVPPSTPSDGDRYFIPNSPAPTGAWAGHSGQIAEWDDESEGWLFTEQVPEGTVIYDADSGQTFGVDGAGNKTSPPYTPAIPPLTEDSDPVLENYSLVAYHSGLQEYRKVPANQVGGGGSDVLTLTVLASSYAGGKWYGRTYANNVATGKPAWSSDGKFWIVESLSDETVKELVLGFDGHLYGLAGTQVGRSDAENNAFAGWTYVTVDDFPLISASGSVTWDHLRIIDGAYYMWSRDFHRTSATPFDFPVIMTSADGVSWTQVINDLPKLFTMIGLDYNVSDSRWLAFGHLWEEVSPSVFELRPQVYESSDGATYTLLAEVADDPDNDNWQVITFCAHGDTYLMGMGNSNSTLVGELGYSTDGGDTWTISDETWPAGSPAQAIVGSAFDGFQYLVSGRDWVGRSTDLSAWTIVSGLLGEAEGFSPLLSDGLGRTVAALSTSTTFDTASTTDGAAWERMVTLPEWVPGFVNKLPQDVIAQLAVFHPGVPSSSKLMFQYTVPDLWSIPLNLVGSVGSIGTNPTSSFVATLSVNGSSIGTVTISTGGVFSFSVAATALTQGDKITLTAPSSADATAADIAITLALSAVTTDSLTINSIAVGFWFPGSPSNNQLLAKYIAPSKFVIPANFDRSYGDVGTNPTATATIKIVINGADSGTATISTGGVVTFATTTGGALEVGIGDIIELEGQASADATLASISLTIVGEPR